MKPRVISGPEVCWTGYGSVIVGTLTPTKTDAGLIVSVGGNRYGVHRLSEAAGADRLREQLGLSSEVPVFGVRIEFDYPEGKF